MRSGWRHDVAATPVGKRGAFYTSFATSQTVGPFGPAVTRTAIALPSERPRSPHLRNGHVQVHVAHGRPKTFTKP